MDLSELFAPFVESPGVLTLWLANLVLALSVGGAFAWGSFAYLQNAKSREPRKRLLAVSSYLGLMLAVGAIILWPQPITAMLGAGIGLFLLSLCFFFGAVVAHRDRRPSFAFVKTPPASFVQHGPYRFVRHPIYTAYLLTFFALTCLSMIPLGLLAGAWLGYLYFLAARQEELSFRDSPYAQEYQAYRATTGMFFPSFRSLLRSAPQS
jgi:protein-S-isoprenylcysteine O-methyltransferase Ste14